MESKYRVKLTDEEYNAVMKLTAKLKVDSEFDIYDCGETDKFKDWETYKMVSLKTGLEWLYDAMVYPLQHDGLNKAEAELIVNLMVEFDVMRENEKEYFLKEEN